VTATAAMGELQQVLVTATTSLRSFVAAQYDVRCDQHGRMKYGAARSWWTCPGFDGEGCPVIVRMATITGGAASGLPDCRPGELDRPPGGWHLWP
jgi:hypothetical protein